MYNAVMNSIPNQEDSINRNASFLRGLLEIIPNQAIIGLSTNCKIISWNKGAAATLQYEENEVLGADVKSLLDVSLTAHIDSINRSGQKSAKFHALLKSKDGNVLSTELQLSRVENGGELLGYGLLLSNQCEPSQNSERLRQTEEIFDLMVSAVKDYAIFLMDINGNIKTWNAGALRMTGYADYQVIGKNFCLFYPQEDLSSGHPLRELQTATKEGRWQEEAWRVRSDGSLFWASITITPVFSLTGEHTGFVQVTRDLTEQGQARKELQLSEQNFRMMVSSIKDYAIFMLDREGLIASWNDGAQRIKGYTAEEILGKHFSVFYTEEQLARRHPQHELQIASQTGRYEEEDWRVRKDGTRFWASVTITAIRSGTGELKGFVKVTKDLTDRKRTEQELERARDEAMLASQLKTEFIANVSHEIRTPMAGIIGMAEQLVVDDTLTEDQKEAAEHVFRSSKRLLDVLNDLLDFTKLEARRVTIDEHEFSLSEVLTEVVDSISQPARKKNLTVELAIDESLPEKIYGDSSKIRQVLLNLGHNAVKFTKSGSVKLAVQADSKEHIRFEVSDTGIGLKEDAGSFLFQPFVQADGSTRRKFGGTGLGLSISKKYVELMGGTIGFSSEFGQGSTFWFTLPLKIAPTT